MEPDLNGLVSEAEADDDVVGLVLIGSYASGTPDVESDALERGFGHGYDDWGGEIDRAMTFRF